MTDMMETELPQACPRILAAPEVLDLHADLHRMLSKPDPLTRQIFTEYIREETGPYPQWRASHLHPSASLDNLQPWLDSLGFDLAGATTFQVTAEMIDLATALQVTTPDLADLVEEDLPADWGFMWFDKPVPRPSVEDGDDPPLLMHAVSWARVPSMPVRLNAGDGKYEAMMPGVRIREWGWNDDRLITPRPLHLMGQSTAILAPGIRTPLPELQLVHMLWILMGMEITASNPAILPRATRKRAAGLRHADVRVITLRRPVRAEPEKEHHAIDWSCSWLVRGHWRQAPRGTFKDGRDRTWVRPYIKGPDGLPLRATDILYKLAR